MNEIMFNFPDISNYNLDSPGSIALYNAHIDFFSIHGLIESTKKSIDDIRRQFTLRAIIANDYGDCYTHQLATNNIILYNSRIVPLAYTSILLIIISALEESFNCLCNSYYIANNYSIQFTDLHGQGLERAINYLEKVVGINDIRKEKQWELIKTARDVRNAITHNGGRIKDKNIKKFEKFNFYIAEENRQIYIEYDTLINLYNEILNFIDKVFSKTPAKNSI
ncbi:hypothetical protein [Clostridium paraputrificum]|uniref:hypothetical protein n=1 Tax=Clostridium paraputrificum TaxID=29363 RepID=UPI00232E74E9|nr:hypothetical protein [Clostridium paraputrificum]MDB2108453.1 hypothetical protein [Clostridium paraputrificum]MDB2115324.1 hypothetical protein [Clostridium paraputrificum]